MSELRAARSSFTEIPLVDMAGDRRTVAAAIIRACEDVGFLYIVNHGVPASQMSGIIATSKKFFDLPLERKMPLRLSQKTCFRGYLPAGIDGGTSAGNRKEAFQMLRDEGLPEPSAMPWPAGLPDFQAAMFAYFTAMEQLAIELLELFADGLNLPPATFTTSFTDALSMLRLLHYPPQAPTDTAIGSQPHTDSGALTILLQDDAGGLEVINADGEWTRVPPVEGAFVVNIGEMMKLWTDGRFSATPHRVINASGRDRFSIPFFANPAHGTVVTPLIAAGRRREAYRLVGHVEAGKPVTSGEVLFRSWNRLWG